jgi:hypothetical protein
LCSQGDALLRKVRLSILYKTMRYLCDR